VSVKGKVKQSKNEVISDDSSEYDDANSSIMNMSLDFAGENDNSSILIQNRPMEIKEPQNSIRLAMTVNRKQHESSNLNYQLP